MGVNSVKGVLVGEIGDQPGIATDLFEQIALVMGSRGGQINEVCGLVFSARQISLMDGLQVGQVASVLSLSRVGL